MSRAAADLLALPPRPPLLAFLAASLLAFLLVAPSAADRAEKVKGGVKLSIAAAAAAGEQKSNVLIADRDGAHTASNSSTDRGAGAAAAAAASAQKHRHQAGTALSSEQQRRQAEAHAQAVRSLSSAAARTSATSRSSGLEPEDNKEGTVAEVADDKLGQLLKHINEKYGAGNMTLEKVPGKEDEGEAIKYNPKDPAEVPTEAKHKLEEHLVQVKEDIAKTDEAAVQTQSKAKEYIKSVRQLLVDAHQVTRQALDTHKDFDDAHADLINYEMHAIDGTIENAMQEMQQQPAFKDTEAGKKDDEGKAEGKAETSGGGGGE